MEMLWKTNWCKSAVVSTTMASPRWPMAMSRHVLGAYTVMASVVARPERVDLYVEHFQNKLEIS